jgi:hypothetical protein
MNQSLHEAVKVIKTAILKAQSEVLRNANTSLLSLYYGIGRYVSQNSREGTWLGFAVVVQARCFVTRKAKNKIMWQSLG